MSPEVLLLLVAVAFGVVIGYLFRRAVEVEQRRPFTRPRHLWDGDWGMVIPGVSRCVWCHTVASYEADREGCRQAPRPLVSR